MVWPFKPSARAPKSNVVPFPVVKRMEPRNIIPFAPKNPPGPAWYTSEKIEWKDYNEMLEDILIDIRVGHVSPSGILVAVVDEREGIDALACYTRGLTKEEVAAVCQDILDSND
jgi:hypothetical protein